MKLKNLLFILMLMLFLVSCSNEKIEEKGVNISELSNSVFKLSVADENGNLIAEGSGFCIYDSKTLITNYHVIEDGYSIKAASQNEIIYNIAGVYHYDEDRDIAILKLENNANCPVLTIAKDYKVGEEVYAIGSPLGLKNTISNGLISAERENGEYIDLQISAPISSGSSGGALLNVDGEVVGVTYAGMIDGQNLNFAIPMTYFNNIELDDSKIKTLSNIIEENTPGNLLVNYHFNGGEPFVVDFDYNGNFFVVYEYGVPYEETSGLTVISESLDVEKKLKGYKCPNYYKNNLYCIEKDTKKILTISIEDILSDNYNFDCLMDLSNRNVSIDSIFVSNDKIVTRIENSVIISDTSGKVLSEFEDEGISSAIMTDSNTLAYVYGENGIKILNLETLETSVVCANVNFNYINGHFEGNYFLSSGSARGFNYIYNSYDNSIETFDLEQSYARSYYNDFLIVHEQPRTGPGFYGITIVNKRDSIYAIQLSTGIKFKIPVNLFNGYKINYGKNNKMYIVGEKENGRYLYRMNLDCTGLEEIGLVEYDENV